MDALVGVVGLGGLLALAWVLGTAAARRRGERQKRELAPLLPLIQDPRISVRDPAVVLTGTYRDYPVAVDFVRGPVGSAGPNNLGADTAGHLWVELRVGAGRADWRATYLVPAFGQPAWSIDTREPPLAAELEQSGVLAELQPSRETRPSLRYSAGLGRLQWSSRLPDQAPLPTPADFHRTLDLLVDLAQRNARINSPPASGAPS